MVTAHIAGYAFAIVVGHFATWYVSKLLWHDLAVPSTTVEEIRPRSYHATLVGLVERPLYIAAIQMEVPEFIAVWLALKVAGKWNRWSDGFRKDDQVTVIGRAFFNVFLIGNALSIAYALVGERITSLWLMGEVQLVFLIPTLLVAATAVIAIVVKANSESGTG